VKVVDERSWDKKPACASKRLVDSLASRVKHILISSYMVRAENSWAVCLVRAWIRRDALGQTLQYKQASMLQ
jgi:hypothetical protein